MEPNNNQELNSIQLRQTKEKRTIIEQLEKTPIIQLACERAGVSRASFYRWREQDKEFDKNVRKALADGETFINELSEAQVISLIKEKKFQAIQLWLKHHHPKYTNKIEVTGNINISEEPLSEEQNELAQKALKLAGLPVPEKEDKQNE
jgi:hypothetical protein